jgi:type IV pilus assembly protein PilO
VSVLDDVLDRPASQKLAIVGGLILALVTIDWTYWYGPNGEALSALYSKAEDLRAELDTKKARTNAKAAAEKELRDLNGQLKEAAARLPDQREIADLLSEVAASGRAAGLDITLFRQKPEAYHEFYADVPVQMEMRGTFDDVVDFLDRVGRMDRIVNVSDIALKRPQVDNDQVVLQASCTTTTFRFLDEQERARLAEEKKKGQQAGKKGKGA